jgi:type IV pilus assembly protein PilM
MPGIGEPNLRAPEAVAARFARRWGRFRRAPAPLRWCCPTPWCASSCWTSIPCPAKAAEAFPVLRFRLRKMVPFDVEHAGLSYQVLVENKTSARCWQRCCREPILAEYEAAVRAAGYEPGAVLPTAWRRWRPSIPWRPC